jgi:hypothetical protein
MWHNHFGFPVSATKAAESLALPVDGGVVPSADAVLDCSSSTHARMDYRSELAGVRADSDRACADYGFDRGKSQWAHQSLGSSAKEIRLVRIHFAV